MLKFTVLAFTLVASAASWPAGCSSGQTTDDTTPTERGSITVTATATQSADVGETVTLQATATAPADGGTLYYTWQQTGGPGVKLSGSDQASATYTAPSIATARTIVIVVTVRDDAGDVGRAEVRTTVSADPDYQAYSWTGSADSGSTAGSLTANAGEDQRTLPGTTVTLDGSGSVGTALTYHWHQISGTTVQLTSADTVTATFTAPDYAKDGVNDLVFELAATDGANRTVTDRMTVKVRNPNASNNQVRMRTTMGDIVVQLDLDKAPKSSANFLQYVDEGFYDGTIIHRVISGFVIQGGGYLPGLKEKATHDPIVNEASNGLKNVRGSLAMARTNDPDSATSQWYINLVDNTDLDYSSTNAGYAVFGTVIEGMDVVDRIANVETTTESGFQDVPVTDILVRTAARVD